MKEDGAVENDTVGEAGADDGGRHDGWSIEKDDCCWGDKGGRLDGSLG